MESRIGGGHDETGAHGVEVHAMRINGPAVVAVGAIFAVTLVPAPGGGGGGDAVFCLICGERGLADVILNVLLFAPLGAALARGGGSAVRPVLVGGLVSLTVEVLQIGISGRDASPGDLLMNTLGAALGAFVVRTAGVWVDPPPRRARKFSAAALGGALGVLALGGWLLSPSWPDTVYYGQWTPEFGNLEHYGGRVLDAAVGDLPLPSRRLADSDAVREALARGVELRVDAIAGPPPAGLAPIFNIYDDRQREILFIGAYFEDLVLRYRTRSAEVRLDRPELRWIGGLEGVAEGDPLRLRLRRSEGGYCLEVNGVEHCPPGYTVRDVWGVLYFAESEAPELRDILGLCWLVILFAPAGFWLRRRRDAAVACAATCAGLLAAPAAVGLATTSPAEFAAALAGLGVGAAFRRVAQAMGAGSIGRRADDAASTSAATQRSMRA
jgi:hypothetical protein